ncbi:MAG: putative membrane protein [Anaerolineaceae bacterium 46_22]|jgi:integral membrane protein (TIGR01906 family)|nr:MAG: putative membrane protein [Anaerolineae bacterium 49_20]KUK97997.1 MAG: putative membrane protein [Anaerolineaceae bacterium 46_22]
MNDQAWYLKTSQWLISVLTPFVILMISVRILITPLFAKIEYKLPGFPEDPYGFTMQDRLRWSEPSIRYLVNNEDIDYLEVLAFNDGEPIFNDRELSHMVDVKGVVTGMRVALAIFFIFLVICVWVLLKKGRRDFIISAFYMGGWGLIGLIAAILLLVAISFNQLFTWFHQIFFSDGTWQFYTSDTLIRLFPMRFWRDAFIFVGVLSLIIAGVVIITTRKHFNFKVKE